MIENLQGKVVVIDLSSLFVCIGTLQSCGEHYYELVDADLHDLRDSTTGREGYISDCRSTGIKRNRRKVYVARREIVGISLFDDFVDE